MGVYIEGMEMPGSCYKCPLRRRDGMDIVCPVAHERFSVTDVNILEYRLDNCPLILAAEVRPVVLCRDCKHSELMYDELVKRLRDAAKLIEALAVFLPHGEGSAVSKMYNEAADAIEELSARLEAHNEWFAKADKKIEEYKAAYIAEQDARIAECKRELTEKEQEAHNAFLKMAVRCGQAEPPKE